LGGKKSGGKKTLSGATQKGPVKKQRSLRQGPRGRKGLGVSSHSNGFVWFGIVSASKRKRGVWRPIKGECGKNRRGTQGEVASRPDPSFPLLNDNLFVQ